MKTFRYSHAGVTEQVQAANFDDLVDVLAERFGTLVEEANSKGLRLKDYLALWVETDDPPPRM